MGLVGILFGQKRSIIGVRDSLPGGFLSQVAQSLSQSLVNQWSAGNARVGIVVDALVSEEPSFSAEVTKNPIEGGAKISDHVQLKPVELTMEGVISDAPLGYAVIGNIQNLVRQVSNVFLGSSRSLDAFNELLALRNNRMPFTVITSLKRYQNMIMTELSVPRTAQTGNAIHFRCKMEEVVIVSSQTTSNMLNLSSTAKKIGQKTANVGTKVADAQKKGDSGFLKLVKQIPTSFLGK